MERSYSGTSIVHIHEKPQFSEIMAAALKKKRNSKMRKAKSPQPEQI